MYGTIKKLNSNFMCLYFVECLDFRDVFKISVLNSYGK